MTTKQTRHPSVSTGYLIRKLRAGGMKSRAARLVVWAVIGAIREAITEGRSISLPHIGTFYFGFRIGRKMPEITTGRQKYRRGPSFQADSYPLKFQPDWDFNREIRDKFKHTKPLHVRRKKKHGNGYVHKAIIKPDETQTSTRQTNPAEV